MESTVETIMTGTADINQVIKLNKDQIQSLNSTLESIIHKGYFEIIKNTESLQSLSLSQEIPKIVLPSPINLNLPPKQDQQSPIEDQIWDLINQRKYTSAAQLITKSSCESINRLKKLLKSPYFFNVFTLQDHFIDRILCLDVLENEIEGRVKRITKFIIDQLVQVLKENADYELNFQKSRDILSELFGNDEEKEIKLIVEQELNHHLPSLKTKLLIDLEKTFKIPELEKFISTTKSSFSIPTVWDLISPEWEQKALNLLTHKLALSPLTTLKETLQNYEFQTSEIFTLFRTYTQVLNSFHQNIEKNLSNSIISSIPINTPPLLILGFFTYFKQLPIYSIFPSLDFSEFINETEKIVSEELKSKDILSICMEIRTVCGDKSVFLPSLAVKFGPSQSGFGVLVGKQPENCELKDLNLPKPLKMIPRVQLPLTLSTHLLLT